MGTDFQNSGIDFNTKRLFGPIPKYPRVEDFKAPTKEIIILAGPCSIESEAQVDTIAEKISHYPITFMRGGVFRAGTYPPDNFGLNEDKLKYFHSISHSYRLKNIVEVFDVRHIDIVAKYSDAFQIGARAMQNYALLNEIKNCGRTVTLKKHHGATLDEFLGAAEYLLSGNCNPILIERGSVSYLNHTRWDLSISIIPAIKKITGIPILVDASHGTGRSDLVIPMTLAGLAAGADGYLVEIHPNPEQSLSDKEQALDLKLFPELFAKSYAIKNIV